MIADTSYHHRADLYLYNIAEIISMYKSILAAVALIDVVFFERYRVYGMQYAFDEGVACFNAAVDIAVAVVIIDLKTEYQAESAVEAVCEEFVVDEV